MCTVSQLSRRFGVSCYIPLLAFVTLSLPIHTRNAKVFWMEVILVLLGEEELTPPGADVGIPIPWAA
jgi:hypothetical protein